MPRRVTPSRDRWLSPTYTSGYVENRNGTATLRYADKRKSTGLRFAPLNRKLCIEMLALWLDQIHKGDEPAAPSQRVKGVKELIRLYRETRFPMKASSAKVRLRSAFAHYFPDAAPDQPLNVTSLVAYISARKGKVPVQTSTNRRLLERLRELFDFGIEIGAIDRNPVTIARIPKEVRKKVRHFTNEEIIRIYLFFLDRDEIDRREGSLRHDYSHTPYAYYWLFLYLTGVRPSEALRCEWSHVTATGIRILESKRGAEEDLETGKMIRTSERWIPLTSPPFEPLLAVLELLRLETGGEGRIFPWWSVTGGPSKALHKALKAIGADDGRQQRHFRPSAATRWREEFGLSKELISDLLGNTVRIQEQHYRADREAAHLADAICREMRLPRTIYAPDSGRYSAS